MKKLLAALLAAMMILSCLTVALADAGSEPDWSEYDKLIADAKVETDLAAREDMLHHAEELLMDTGAVLPLYYDSSALLMRTNVSGVYNDPFGITYFQNAAVEGSDTLRVNLFSEPDTITRRSAWPWTRRYWPAPASAGSTSATPRAGRSRTSPPIAR